MQFSTVRFKWRTAKCDYLKAEVKEEKLYKASFFGETILLISLRYTTNYFERRTAWCHNFKTLRDKIQNFLNSNLGREILFHRNPRQILSLDELHAAITSKMKATLFLSGVNYNNIRLFENLIWGFTEFEFGKKIFIWLEYTKTHSKWCLLWGNNFKTVRDTFQSCLHFFIK